MQIVCADLEGVFVPEIWINVAERTHIPELRLTTRDIADYDELMRYRLAILEKKQLRLQDIQAVIATMDPLDGAVEFLNWVRAHSQLIVLSDTFTQFASPLMAKLGWPALFCHSLEVAPDGRILNYRLRQRQSKKKAVQALQSLNFDIIAVGDSYNDIEMLLEAQAGLLFRPPQNVTQEYPQIPVTETYQDLKTRLTALLGIGS